MYKESRKDYRRNKKPIVHEKYVHPKNFISNIHKDDEELIMKAAKMSNCSVYTDDRGFNHHGIPLKDMISVFSGIEDQDLSQMWIVFNELKANQN